MLGKFSSFVLSDKMHLVNLYLPSFFIIIVLELACTMGRNEKCDAYSFGIVALEFIMGRHPADLSSSIATIPEVQPKNILDQRVPHPIDEISAHLIHMLKPQARNPSEHDASFSRPFCSKICCDRLHFGDQTGRTISIFYA